MPSEYNQVKTAVRSWADSRLPLTRLVAETNIETLLGARAVIPNDSMSTQETLARSIDAFNALVTYLVDSITAVQAHLVVVLNLNRTADDWTALPSADVMHQRMAEFRLPSLFLVDREVHRYLDVCEHYAVRLPAERYLSSAYPGTDVYYCETRNAVALQRDWGSIRYIHARYTIGDQTQSPLRFLPVDFTHWDANE